MSGLDLLKQQIEKKAYDVCEPLGEGEQIIAIRVVKLSDVLKLVGDLEKSHIIKSRKQLEEVFIEAKDEICDQQHNIAPANTVEMFVVDVEDVHKLVDNIVTKLLGDEK